MAFVGRIPNFPDWMTLKDEREENGTIENQVAPDQNMECPIESSRFHGCEDADQLEEQRGFC